MFKKYMKPIIAIGLTVVVLLSAVTVNAFTKNGGENSTVFDYFFFFFSARDLSMLAAASGFSSAIFFSVRF